MGLWYKVAKVEEPQDALRTRERYEFLQTPCPTAGTAGRITWRRSMPRARR